jgi:hypothetical protein
MISMASDNTYQFDWIYNSTTKQEKCENEKRQNITFN